MNPSNQSTNQLFKFTYNLSIHLHIVIQQIKKNNPYQLIRKGNKQQNPDEEFYKSVYQIKDKNQKIQMKIIVTKILSLAENGACCYLLNIGDEAKVLLDCGMPHDFSFQQYEKFKSEIQCVNLILISHSSVQYCGALPFLIQQFSLQPKIIYTTQPIMRYAPLNLHQQILNMRYQNYDKKIFNKIYSIFETINVIKPYQKKAISIDVKTNDQSLLKGTTKSVYFSCYQAGGTLSGLCWKIRMGLANILYLVDYNNFSLNHINGLDFEAIKNQPVNLLLTDMCPVIGDDKIKKDKLYIDIKNILLDFYSRQGIDPIKPRPFFGDNQKRLLFTCYPSEMLLEIMITLRKVITDMQQITSREKVVVVHLSSRYLQLIKSQVDNFTQEMKTYVDKIDEFFIHSKSLTCRISVASVNHINGILNTTLINNQQIVDIYHFGQTSTFTKLNQNLSSAKKNISTMKLFKINSITDEKIQNQLKLEDGKIEEEIQVKEEVVEREDNDDDDDQEGNNNINLKIQRSFSSMLKHEKQNIPPQPSLYPDSKPKSLIGKYISQISFPHFIKSHKQQQFDFNDYGLKHHLMPSSRPQKRTILDMNINENNQELELPELGLIAKKSTVEVMNIDFQVGECFTCVDDVNTIAKVVECNFLRTNFNSSIRILQILNPKNVFILNSSADTPHDRLFKQYKSNFKNHLYNLATCPRNQCIVQIQNQLVEYKVNYLPLGQNLLQKVKGRVESINGVIHLHIQILQQKEILEFRLEKFYKQCKGYFGKQLCKFTGNGIMIAGVKIYRLANEIILQGEYSEAYFKVRTLLYQFLQIR